MSNRLRQLEQDISYGEKRRSELFAQLKAALAEDNSKPPEQSIVQIQAESDKPLDYAGTRREQDSNLRGLPPIRVQAGRNQPLCHPATNNL